MTVVPKKSSVNPVLSWFAIFITVWNLIGAGVTPVIAASGSPTSPEQGVLPAAEEPMSLAAVVPTLNTITPSSATAGENQFTLNFDGTAFANDAIALWDCPDFSNPLDSCKLATSILSDSQITAIIPASLIAVAGAHQVTVINPGTGGGPALPTLAFTVNAYTPPAGIVISPTSAEAAPVNPFTITVTATSNTFLNSAKVVWTPSGSPATELATTFVNSTTLTAIVPASYAATAGTADVSVSNVAGLSQLFTITNPASPTITITGLSPANKTAGEGDFTLTVYGTGFVNNTDPALRSVVQWAGTNLSTTYTSDTQLTAYVSSSLITYLQVGDVAITVNNPAPGGGTSAAVTFRVNNAGPTHASGGPVLTLTSLTTTSVVVGAAATDVILYGTNFNPLVGATGSIVYWNCDDTTAATCVTTLARTAPGTDTTNQLTVTIPVGLLTTVGSFPIRVFNPAAGVNPPAPSGGGMSNYQTFTVAPTYQQPTITSMATIDVSDVRVDPATGFLALNSDDSSNSFILEVNDTTVYAGTTDGSFIPGSSVIRWDNVTLTADSEFTPTTRTLRATVPASYRQVPRMVNITVYTALPNSTTGTTSAPSPFAVRNPVPTISGFSPTYKYVGDGDFTLTVTGTNFTPGTMGTRILWAGADLTNTTIYYSTGQVTIIVPKEKLLTAGTASIGVYNPPVEVADGGTATYGTLFDIYNPVPTITSITPASISAGYTGTVRITINGSGFVSGVTRIEWWYNSTTWTYLQGAQVTFVSKTQLLFDVPNIHYTASLANTTGYLRAFNPAPPTDGQYTGYIAFSVLGVPQKATLVSPSSLNESVRPRFVWTVPANSALPTYFYLWLNSSSTTVLKAVYSLKTDFTTTVGSSEVVCEPRYVAPATAYADPTTGVLTCYVTPTITLSPGNYKWWIQNKNGYGSSSWSSYLTFAVVPGSSTPSGPIGDTLSTTPTFTWSSVTGAVKYIIGIRPVSSAVETTYEYSTYQWCTSASCSVTLPTALAEGQYVWTVTSKDSNGNGTKSADIYFNVINGKIDLNYSGTTPRGNTYTIRPTFTWKRVNTATYYYIWVNNWWGSTVFKGLVASVYVCANPSSTMCTYTPGLSLPAGTYRWWIQTRTSAYSSAWSSPMSFTVSVPPRATTGFIPTSGANTTNPIMFTWDKVDGATNYMLWINSTSGNVHNAWYAEGNVCTGTKCYVTLTKTLSKGSYKWWILTNNTVGSNSWSASQYFNVP